MIVFDLLRAAEGRGTSRAVLFGSCRVHTPILEHGAAGGVAVRSYLPPFSHTLAGALALFGMATGSRAVPADLQPYLLGERAVGEWPRRMIRQRHTVSDAGIFVAEVCTDGQLVYDGLPLHPTMFGLRLAPLIGPAFSQWVQTLTKAGQAPADLIAEATAEADGVGQLTPTLAAILRDARFVRYSEADVRAQLKALRQHFGGTVVLVSHLADPADGSNLMKRRRRLNAMLARIADGYGVRLFDPSVLFAHRPREAVFADGGANTTEYQRSLVPQVGQALAEAVAQPRWDPAAAIAAVMASKPLDRATAFIRPGQTVEALTNAFLAERLAEMGPIESGLEAHYTKLLGEGTVFTERGLNAFWAVKTELRPGARINHVGSSIGELPAALAAAGYRVSAYINDNRRLRAAEALRERLEREGVVSPGSLRFSRKPLPARGADLFLAIHAIFDGGRISTEELFRTLALHREALIDLRNFGYRRDAEGDRLDLVDALDHLGYGDRLLPVGGDLAYGKRRGGWRWPQWVERLRARSESRPHCLDLAATVC